MATMTRLDPTDPGTLAALAAAGSLAALAGALFFEHVVGLPPCPLCHDQRYAHLVVLAPALAALLVPGRHAGLRAVLAALAAVALLGSAGIAGYHVGVEQGWWQGPSGCGSPAMSPGMSVEDLRAQILAAPVVRCDEVPWSLFGISMAGYNFLLSLALALVILAGLARRGGVR